MNQETKIKTIAVLGAGQMGAGIAQVFAQNGFTIIINDVSQAALSNGTAIIDRNLEKQISKGKITTNQKKETLARIRQACCMDQTSGKVIPTRLIIDL